MVKRVVILGGGAGGVVTAHRLAKKLKKDEAEIILVDKSQYHEFRPSYLWVATGVREPDDIRRPLSLLTQRGIKIVNAEVREINPSDRTVKTTTQSIDYDYLVVSLGAELRQENLRGGENTYHAWELEDAVRLRRALAEFRGGRVVIGPASKYYRCAPAPFELALMIRYISEQRNISEKTEIKVIHPAWRAPMEPFGQFMQNVFKNFLDSYNIEFLGLWELDHVDGERRKLVSKDGDEIEYDLPIIIPPHTASRVVAENPDLADKTTSYMLVDRRSLRNPSYDDVFGIGDIVSPTLGLGMAGVFAHFEGDYVATQIIDEIKGVHMAMSYNKSGICVMDIGYLGAAVYCDFTKVIEGSAKYPDCWMLGGMKAFRGAKIAFEKIWFAELFGR